MSRTSRLLSLFAILAAPCLADTNASTVITNWIPGYRYIAATNEDVGTTGISTGTAYVCFPLSGLTFLTATAANHATGDVRAVQFALVKSWQIAYAGSTNTLPERLTIDENIQQDDSTAADVRYILNIKAYMSLSATGVTLIDE